MNMFPSFLDTLPKNRSEMVNDLDIPDDVTVTPYIWNANEEFFAARNDSLLSSTDSEPNTLSTDSSLALSRAMTDSEIDYSFYRRLKTRSNSDPWCSIRTAIAAFPPGHISSLNSFQTSTSELTDDSILRTYRRTRDYNEELRQKMERYFDEIRVFTPEDPELVALEEALKIVDDKILDSSDLDSIIAL